LRWRKSAFRWRKSAGAVEEISVPVEVFSQLPTGFAVEEKSAECRGVCAVAVEEISEPCPPNGGDGISVYST